MNSELKDYLEISKLVFNTAYKIGYAIGNAQMIPNPKKAWQIYKRKLMKKYKENIESGDKKKCLD